MDGFIVTNANGQALSLYQEGALPEDLVDVLTTVKEVAAVQEQCEDTVVYALVAVPAQYVSYIVDNRTHGMTKAAILHDMALRFIGTLPWPDGSLPDPSETAQSLADLDEPADTWKE